MAAGGLRADVWVLGSRGPALGAPSPVADVRQGEGVGRVAIAVQSFAQLNPA